MYKPTCKGYFSGCGGAELGMMQAGVNVIQSLDLDKDAIDCMNDNKHYFGHNIKHQDIKDVTVLSQEKSDIILGTYPYTLTNDTIKKQELESHCRNAKI